MEELKTNMTLSVNCKSFSLHGHKNCSWYIVDLDTHCQCVCHEERLIKTLWKGNRYG